MFGTASSPELTLDTLCVFVPFTDEACILTCFRAQREFAQGNSWPTQTAVFCFPKASLCTGKRPASSSLLLVSSLLCSRRLLFISLPLLLIPSLILISPHFVPLFHKVPFSCYFLPFIPFSPCFFLVTNQSNCIKCLSIYQINI